MNSLKRQQWRDLRNTSPTTKKEIISSSNIRWSLRQKCATTGNCLENANFKILALSHMVIMNCRKRSIYLTTTKQNSVLNFTPHLTVLMETDASFCIPNTIYSAKNHLTTPSSYMKMLGSVMKELFKLMKMVIKWIMWMYSPQKDSHYLILLRSLVHLRISDESIASQETLCINDPYNHNLWSL